MGKFLSFLSSYLLLCQVVVGKEKLGFSSTQNYFTANRGQIIDQNNNYNSSVLYHWKGNGLNVQLKKNSFSYDIVTVQKKPREINQIKDELRNKHLGSLDSTTFYYNRIDIELPGSNLNPIIIPLDKGGDYSNYYNIPGQEEGVTSVPHFGKVLYKNIYDKIDIEFLIEESGFKYNFIVHPGGDLKSIRLKYIGAYDVKISGDGELILSTGKNLVNESIPHSYLMEGNTDISVRYKKYSDSIIGFITENYDLDKTLVVDPWATYYGGIYDDMGFGTSTDKNGNIYLTCQSVSPNIATAGAYQTNIIGSSDAILVKFNSAGSRLWSTYYGGIYGETAIHSNTDSAANVFLGGTTGSYFNIATPGAYQTGNAGVYDAFIAKFDSAGIRLWGTFFGGSGEEQCFSLTTDSYGNVLITGLTESSNNIATPGASLTSWQGYFDAYLAKFSPSGVLLWATYYGGAGSDCAFGITTDKHNNVIITGETSTYIGIATPNVHQVLYGGGSADAFIAKFSSTGNKIWSSYYGGTGPDIGRGVGCDNSDYVYMGGSSSSASNISTPNTFQPIYGGLNDAFVVKFDSSGSRIWGSYFGGPMGDECGKFQTDKNGNSIFGGGTNSSTGISSPLSYQPSKAPGLDAFIFKIDSTGNRLWASYFGGNNNEEISGVSFDIAGNVIAAGQTESSNNIATYNGFQTTFGGIIDAFLFKMDSAGGLLPFIGNNIIGSSQTICSETQPSILTGSLPFILGGGACQYLWIESTVNSSTAFTPANGTNNLQNYQPSQLYSTTWYKRIVINGSHSDTSSAIVITVNSLPVPTISSTGNILSVNQQYNSFQWFLNGIIIPGATAQSLQIINSGVYSVKVSDSNNCEGLSLGLVINNLQELEYAQAPIQLLPNPTSGEFELIRLDGRALKGFITLRDLAGRALNQSKIDGLSYHLDISYLSSGCYLISFVDFDGVKTTARIIKE
jgi:hypothetical protein